VVKEAGAPSPCSFVPGSLEGRLEVLGRDEKILGMGIQIQGPPASFEVTREEVILGFQPLLWQFMVLHPFFRDLPPSLKKHFQPPTKIQHLAAPG